MSCTTVTERPSITITALRDELSETINRVKYRNERVSICRRDEKVAAVVSIEDVELLEQIEELIDLRTALAALREVEREGTISLADFRKELGV